MKRDTLNSLIEQRLNELRNEIDEDGNKLTSYSLFQFCIEVIPEDERQSKHIDILEYLLDSGVQIRWRGLKFQPVHRNK